MKQPTKDTLKKEILEEFRSVWVSDGKLDSMIKLGEEPDVIEPSDERYCKRLEEWLNHTIDRVREDYIKKINEVTGHALPEDHDYDEECMTCEIIQSLTSKDNPPTEG